MNLREIENGILHIYKNDAKLAKVIDASIPCTIRKKKDYYYAFVRAIIGQQLSGKAADAIEKKFMLYFENKPLPEKIISVKDEELRNLGLSWAKVKYVKDLSEKILMSEVHFKNLNKRSDEELISDFTKIKGIGIWTVQMFLIFTLGRLNVLPVNDLGIRKGIMKVYGLRKMPPEKKINQIAKRNNWHPYCTIASWYLWRSLEID